METSGDLRAAVSSLPRPSAVTLSGGASSADELAQRALDAFVSADTATLLSLLVSEQEYATVVFPELGVHYATARDPRPETRQFLWEMQRLNAEKGMRKALKEIRGAPLVYSRIRMKGAGRRFRTYNIYEDPVMSVRGPDGREVDVLALGSIIELDGTYKLMAYRDLD